MIWPDNKRIAVMLAFDLDVETLWELYGEQENPANMSRGTYGAIQGMPRILSMLDRQGVKATFFTPGKTIERYPELTQEIVARGHEIGYHGYAHTSSPDRDEEHRHMLKVEKMVRQLTGQRIVGQRAPSGTIYDYTLGLFLQHGYIYSSNWRDSDGPYIHRIGGQEVPVVELPKDSIEDDTAFDFFVERAERPWYNMRSAREYTQIWMDEFDGLAEEGRMINFVWHPQLVGRVSRLNAIERMIEYMKPRGAWFETNANVARYVLRQAGYEVNA